MTVVLGMNPTRGNFITVQSPRNSISQVIVSEIFAFQIPDWLWIRHFGWILILCWLWSSSSSPSSTDAVSSFCWVRTSCRSLPSFFSISLVWMNSPLHYPWSKSQPWSYFRWFALDLRQLWSDYYPPNIMRGSGFSSMRALKASPIRSWSPDSICRCCSHPENRALECDHVHIQRCIGTWNVLFAILCELIFSSVESSPRDFDYCPKSRISQQSVALKL